METTHETTDWYHDPCTLITLNGPEFSPNVNEWVRGLEIHTDIFTRYFSHTIILFHTSADLCLYLVYLILIFNCLLAFCQVLINEYMISWYIG